MPHLTLEYSSGLADRADHMDLMKSFHRILSEIGGVRIENCKSRAVQRDVYLVGNAHPADKFVHLDVKMLEGRSPDVKQAVGEALLSSLKEAYIDSGDSPEPQITVQIRDIQRGSYFKYPGGTLPSP